VKLITIYTLLQIPKNDTLPKIADFTIIAKPIQLVRIPTTKTLKIVPVKVNANNQNNKPFKVFVHPNYKV